MPTDPTPWAEYGVLGLVCVTLFGFVVFLMKEHRAERSEWKNDMRADRKESSDATNRLADALHSLESAVRDRK